MDAPTETLLLERIDNLEAMVNGLMLYIAAKEAGADLNLEDGRVKDFIRSHVFRPHDTRLMHKAPGPKALAGDGFWDAYALHRIPSYAEEIAAAFPKQD